LLKRFFGKSCGGREYMYSHPPEIPREPIKRTFHGFSKKKELGYAQAAWAYPNSLLFLINHSSDSIWVVAINAPHPSASGSFPVLPEVHSFPPKKN
jgi:hypothetical protein